MKNKIYVKLAHRMLESSAHVSVGDEAGERWSERYQVDLIVIQSINSFFLFNEFEKISLSFCQSWSTILDILRSLSESHFRTK